MISNVRPTVKLRRLRNRPLSPLVLIACASLLGASTARAGFFGNLLNQAKKTAVQTIKHDLGNQPTSTPAPANPQPVVTPNSAANQPPAANPVGTQSGAVSPASASGNPDPVTVARKVVGPLLSNGENVYTVSLHGSHLATTHMHGSRFVVTVDGVTGPRVDAVLPTYAQFVSSGGTNQTVAMSDDGRHYAYLARDRGKIEVVEDGRKILQFPQHGAITIPYYLVFSPHGGAHLLFAAQKSPIGNEELWVDGKPAPAYIYTAFRGNLPIVTFSADGQHYLYVGTPEYGSSKYVMVVDGKKMGYPLSGLAFGLVAPRFTADGRHVLYARTVKYPAQTVFEDGKPVVTAAQQVDSLVTAPRGSSYAAVVTGGPNGSQNVVYLNGKEVPATRGNNNGAGDVSLPVARFSPDGKHLAVACNYGAGNAYVVLDGKQGDTYDKIYANDTGSPSLPDHDGMKFSADSQSFAYFADAGSKTFAVVDGHEYDPGFDIGRGKIYFSPEGHHVAIEEPDESGEVLYVDGKRVFAASAGGSFAFDRDGSHWMITGQELVVDGQNLPVSSGGSMPCQFSPDGSEVAVVGEFRTQYWGLFLYNTATRRLRLLTKGMFLGKGAFSSTNAYPNVYHVVFSPDSKHLYYVRLDARQEHATIYVDGEKTAAQFDPTIFPPFGNFASSQKASCWYVGADDKLHALVAVGNKVERITITPPPGGLK